MIKSIPLIFCKCGVDYYSGEYHRCPLDRHGARLVKNPAPDRPQLDALLRDAAPIGVGGSAPRATDAPDPRTALRAARQQLITLGGDPRKDPHGDAIQGIVLDLIDEAL